MRAVVGAPGKHALRGKTVVAEQRFPLRLHFFKSVERGVLLNLAGVNGYPGDVETGKTLNVHGIQFGSIEPRPYSGKSPNQ